MSFIDKPSVLLHNGVKIPTLGFRVRRTDKNVYQNVLTAIHAGYRHFDVCSDHDVEKTFARACRDSGLKREDFFLTVKIANSDHGFDAARHGFRNSLSRLQTDYADLLLIDWPNPVGFRDTYEETIVATWHALEEIYKSGSARAIGVANYESRHIEYTLDHSEIAPMLNEARIYPGFPFTDNVDCASSHKIQTEGYLPDEDAPILNSRELKIFAEKYKVTPQQICVRYLFEKDCIALVNGSDEKTLAENFNAYSFRLSSDEMKYLDNMKNYGPENINPDEADF